MFKLGDRVRTNRVAAVRYGVIHEVEEDGTVIGVFDDGLRFIRDASMLDDLVLVGDDPAPSDSTGQGPRSTGPQPGDRVMVIWPDSRRISVVHPSGSYLGRRAVRAGAATVRVIAHRP